MLEWQNLQSGWKGKSCCCCCCWWWWRPVLNDKNDKNDSKSGASNAVSTKTSWESHPTNIMEQHPTITFFQQKITPKWHHSKRNLWRYLARQIPPTNFSNAKVPRILGSKTRRDPVVDRLRRCRHWHDRLHESNLLGLGNGWKLRKFGQPKKCDVWNVCLVWCAVMLSFEWDCFCWIVLIWLLKLEMMIVVYYLQLFWCTWPSYNITHMTCLPISNMIKLAILVQQWETTDQQDKGASNSYVSQLSFVQFEFQEKIEICPPSILWLCFRMVILFFQQSRWKHLKTTMDAKMRLCRPEN